MKLSLSEIAYENFDVPIVITGYDKRGIERWSEVFQYSGDTSNEFSVNPGFDHYRMEASKWGVKAQITVNGDELWNGRIDGPAPVVFTLSADLIKKTLSHSVVYFERADYTNSEPSFYPTDRIDYKYDDSNILRKIVYKRFTSGKFSDVLYSILSYSEGRVAKISQFRSSDGQPTEEYSYKYAADGKIEMISVNHFAAGVKADVSFEYDTTLQKVKAIYTYSNGGGFEYLFHFDGRNLVDARSTKDSQLCSEGGFRYDGGINPFRHLGYMDYYADIRTLSINNRVTENVNYLGCVFPTLIPESYSYQYNDFGYPDVVTTFYKGGVIRSKVERLFYRE